jgi:hypothetical protein
MVAARDTPAVERSDGPPNRGVHGRLAACPGHPSSSPPPRFTDTTSWLAACKVNVEHLNLLITDPRGVEEVVLHLDSDGGRIALPLALAADHDEDGRIIELRLCFSTRPLTGRHANRPPRASTTTPTRR